MKLHTGIACLLLSACAGYASAQSIKPGLWEISTQMQGSGQMGEALANARKEMEGMSPEERKMMQDMMAKQGVQMGTGAGGGMTIKICMTQDMVDRNEVSSGRQGDCTHTNSQRSGNTMKFSYVCTKPPSRGDGQVTFTSSEAYSTKMTSTSTVRGTTEKIEMQSNSRWLGGDCGKVKPLAMPKK